MFLLRGDYFGIGPCGFYVFDVLEGDNHVGAAFTDDQRRFVAYCIFWGFECAEALLDFVFKVLKIRRRNGLEQVVNRFHFDGLKGVFRIGTHDDRVGIGWEF